MNKAQADPVVVGIDGSGTARRALRWAAREAARRHVGLRIVYGDVFAAPLLPGIRGRRTTPPQPGPVRADVETLLAEAAEAARRESPEITVEAVSLPGSPASVLINESSRAGLVVVGDRGLGGFTGLLAGSVAVAVAAHGHSSTAVVRARNGHEQSSTHGPVVVGLDGSRQAEQLLPHGFDAAADYDAPLHVVHTWNLVGVDVRRMRVGLAANEIQAGEERLMSELLGGWSERYPDVAVRHFVSRGSAAAELLGHAEQARLIIVGARGRGGFTGMLLGSTSQALIHHAPCPILVVRTANPR
ncbi:universal stress protein [Saccharopolyspora gloriosae]|uniref:universal stress protein n=1 Tax=Saccharopolyspora gloriosae TaxID=455344 RepID=UPI001FB7DDA6|nr:universal stress protein [Saccharopolyspora gloriosae]